MASLIAQSVRNLGALKVAMLMGSDHIEAQDNFLAEFANNAPSALLTVSPEDLQRSVIQSVCGLVSNCTSERLILVDHDLVVLESLRIAGFRGHIQILPRSDVSASDWAKMAMNIPKGLDMSVGEPGYVPCDINAGRDTVVAMTFDAGFGQSLVSEHASRTLRIVHSINFVGDVFGINPLPFVINDRPHGWEDIGTQKFLRRLVTPDSVSSFVAI